jgi:hypothetical protein
MEASIALPGHFTKIGQEPLDNWNLQSSIVSAILR